MATENGASREGGAQGLNLGDSRAGIRDTAKWVIASSAAVATLAIGGSSFSLLGSMEPGARLVVAVAAATAGAIACWFPFSAAVAVLSQRMFGLDDIVTDASFDRPRAKVDRILTAQYKPSLDSVDKVRVAYNNARTAYYAAETKEEREALRGKLTGLSSRVSEVTEMCVTERLVERFDALMATIKYVGPFIVVCFVTFAWAANPPKDEATELDQIFPVQIAWSAADEAALVASGLKADCFKQVHPSLVAISKLPGLRTRVMAIPQSVDNGCQPVVAVLTNNGELVAP